MFACVVLILPLLLHNVDVDSLRNSRKVEVGVPVTANAPFLHFNSTEVKLVRKGEPLSVKRDKWRASLALALVRDSVKDRSQIPNVVEKVKLAVELLTIMSQQMEVRCALVRDFAINALLDFFESWGGEFFTPTSRCLSVLTMPCTGPKESFKTMEQDRHRLTSILGRIVKFSLDSFDLEAEAQGHIHAMKILNNLGKEHSFNLEKHLPEHMALVHIVHLWCVNDKWVPLSWPRLVAGERVRIEEEIKLVNRVHEAVILLHYLVQSHRLEIHPILEHKLRWLLLDKGTPIPAARAAMAMLEQARKTSFGNMPKSGVISNPADPVPRKKRHKPMETHEAKIVEDAGWAFAIGYVRNLTDHYEEERSVTPGLHPILKCAQPAIGFNSA